MNNKKNLLKTFVHETIVLKEELFRGMPDFVMDDAAKETTDYLKRALTKSMNQRSKSSTDRRELMKTVDKNLNELQDEIHELIREKMQKLAYEL